MQDARIDAGELFRACSAGDVARFRAESFGGFRHAGPVVACAFTVRDRDAGWVSKNLPDDRIASEPAAGGVRFSIETTAVEQLARFVVGLGDAGKAETPELATAVRALAEGALARG